MNSLIGDKDISMNKKCVTDELKNLGVEVRNGKVKKSEILAALKKVTASTIKKMTLDEVEEEVNKKAKQDGLTVLTIEPANFEADRDTGTNAKATQFFHVYISEDTYVVYRVTAVVGAGFYLEVKRVS